MMELKIFHSNVLKKFLNNGPKGFHSNGTK